MFDRALSIIGVALSLVGLVFPYLFPKLPKTVMKAILYCGVGLFAVAVYFSFIPTPATLPTHAQGSINNNRGIITQNQSGGSNTIVNNIPSQRQLNNEQREIIRKSLILPAGKTYPIIVGNNISCSECSVYASDLREVIGGVEGWQSTTGIRTQWIMSPPYSDAGLVIIYKPQPAAPESVPIIIEALKRAGIKVVVEPGGNLLSDEEVALIVEDQIQK